MKQKDGSKYQSGIMLHFNKHNHELDTRINLALVNLHKQDLEWAKKSLSKSQLEIIDLTQIWYSREEIANALQLTENQVKGRLQRVRSKLKKYLRSKV